MDLRPHLDFCWIKGEETALKTRLFQTLFPFISIYWNTYLQKLWPPSPSFSASDLQALLSLCVMAGLSHGRQREPLLVTDVVPLYVRPEPSMHSWDRSAQNKQRHKALRWLTAIVRLSTFVRNCTFRTFGNRAELPDDLGAFIDETPRGAVVVRVPEVGKKKGQVNI